MLRSSVCTLVSIDAKENYDLNECPLDPGGYFIINGQEKVLIAQERMAGNHVYIFARAQPSPISFLAEIRSAVEKGGKTVSTFQVKLYRKGSDKSSGGTIKATLPYIKQDVPIWIVFRAMGVVSDRDILEYICYDQQDPQMLEMLKPCIDEGFIIQNREAALDFIARRGNNAGVSREKRIKYAQEILQKELLPHISMFEGNEPRKAYFLGYMIHRLLLAALDRREIDDRDHFGKKRLDLAGPLLTGLFRLLFRKVSKDCYRYMQKVICVLLFLWNSLDVSSSALRLADYSMSREQSKSPPSLMASSTHSRLETGVINSTPCPRKPVCHKCSIGIPSPLLSPILEGVILLLDVKVKLRSPVNYTILTGAWSAPPRRLKAKHVGLSRISRSWHASPSARILRQSESSSTSGAWSLSRKTRKPPHLAQRSSSMVFGWVCIAIRQHLYER